jgi:tRNA (cytidine56-2'-O)-methyltransferase
MPAEELGFISVLRLGHRRERDKRITSHLGLTARAFGADEIILAGEEDNSPLETWSSVSNRFGGNFSCRYESKPLRLLRNTSNDKSTTIIHLTMYGENMEKIVPKITKNKAILIVVGGAKVPGEVYSLADYNISIGNQPHSEVAALALFMDAWFGEAGSQRQFEDARLVIEGVNGGKVVHDKLEE